MSQENKGNGWKVLGIVLLSILGVSIIAGAFHTGKEQGNMNKTITVGESYELAMVEVDGSKGDTLTGFVGESAEDSTLKIVGGAGTVKASNGGMLTFENLTIEDGTTDTALSAHDEYLSLGGKLQFKNCVFTNSIYIESDAEAEFIGCTFTSLKEDWYSVWVGDGSARFKSCTFTGYRGMKIHEYSEAWYTDNAGEDVKRVEIEDCEFLTLSEKPGLVIGTFTTPKNTTIVVKENRFTDCAAWDTECVAGVDGYYETDTELSEISFYTFSNKVTYDENIAWE